MFHCFFFYVCMQMLVQITSDNYIELYSYMMYNVDRDLDSWIDSC